LKEVVMAERKCSANTKSDGDEIEDEMRVA
jgi:hypothetical protein